MRVGDGGGTSPQAGEGHERLVADAPEMERPGADLIRFYLPPDRHPAGRAWSRKHADTQRRLCARYLAPVISGLACQDITAVLRLVSSSRVFPGPVVERAGNCF